MEQRSGGVLITGGSGYLGRALTKRLLELGTNRICIYSRNEHAQAKMFDELGRPPQLRMWIGDVRDAQRLAWAAKSVGYVIHAAALKRIETGHYNPAEMLKTNVQGTQNVVEAAIAAPYVEAVVYVSSDKACEPVSPYGISKAMGEMLIRESANTVTAGRPRFTAVRYGNVMGSTGSVVQRWRKLIDEGRGDEITITDPDCTRFWMTREAAVELVLNTLKFGEAGTVAIPDLPAFRLGDLATAMGIHAPKVSGLPKWEKKHESLEHGRSSDRARQMSVLEISEALRDV